MIANGRPPCARCHARPRARSSSYCRTCNNEYQRRYRGPADPLFSWRKQSIARATEPPQRQPIPMARATRRSWQP